MAEGGRERAHSEGRQTRPDPLLQEMRAGFRALVGRFDSLDKRLEDLGAEIQAHDRRLDVVETRVSDNEDSAAQSNKRLERVKRILKEVVIENEDTESRSRRNNVRIIGVPETSNTGRLDSFVENLLQELFGKEAYTTGFAVERAHRSLGP